MASFGQATVRSASVVDVAETESMMGDTEEQVARDRRQLDVLREGVEESMGYTTDWLRKTGVSESVDGDSVAGSDDVPTAANVAYAATELQELAMRVQRIARRQLAQRLSKARTVVGADRRSGPERMLQYSLVGSRTMLELDTAGGIYDELNTGSGRVVCQVTARTAIGKTTIFPSRVATLCNRRVLLVEPNTMLASYAADRQRGLVKVRKPWMSKRMAVLTTMSYGDFNGQFRGQGGVDMLQRFDVIIFDEAHLVNDEIAAAKTLVATFSKTASLIVCSATVEGGSDMQATGRPVTVQNTSTTLVELADKGHLTSARCGGDRTLVIATNDAEAQYVAGTISEGGYHVRLIDSASGPDELQKADEFLAEESAVVDRYLVTVPEFGVGANFRCGRLVTSGRKTVQVLMSDEKTVKAVDVVCSKAEIAQQVGRVNRGMTETARALVCVVPEQIPESEEMSESAKLRYYVTLVASHVIPTKALQESVAGVFPFGLNQRVAADLLSINMPIEVAVRYFAADGRVPHKYMGALEAFCEAGYYLTASDHSEPYGRESWVREPMSGYYDEEQALPDIEVPYHATGNLKVQMHAVSAAALGLLTIEDWCPRFSGSDVSDEEKVLPREKKVVYRPRLIQDAPVVRAPLRALAIPYAYNVPVQDQRARRLAIHGGAVDSGHLANLASVDTDTTRSDFKISCGVQEFEEGGVARVGIVEPSATPVSVHSPGGSVVMAFRKTVWKKLVAGEALSPADANSFFHSIKNNVEGFVQSDAFSGWTDVWLAMFRTAGDSDNIAVVKEKNYTTRVISLILALVRRYTKAVREVSQQSSIKASFLKAMMVGSSSYDEVYKKQASRGRAEIMQSEAFLRRVFEIRDAMVDALMVMEENAVFAPGIVIQLQQMLPVMRRTGVRLIDKPTSSGGRYVQRIRGGSV